MKELTTSVQLSFSRSTLEKHKKGSKSQNLPKKTKSSMPSGPSTSKESRHKPKNAQEKRDKPNPLSKRKVSTIIEERGMKRSFYRWADVEKTQ